MRAAAGLHANLAARLDVVLELRDPATTPQPLAPDRPLAAIDAVLSTRAALRAAGRIVSPT